MLEIIEKYNELIQQEKAARDKLDEKIEETEKRLARLEKRRSKQMYTGWVEGTVEPLAKALSELLGLPWEIYGPFGLQCETSIYFRKDMEKSICDQPTYSISLEPRFEGESLSIVCRTGETVKRFSEGTVGEINGMNCVTAPLPDSLGKIKALLKYSDGCHEESEAGGGSGA